MKVLFRFGIKLASAALIHAEKVHGLHSLYINCQQFRQLERECVCVRVFLYLRHTEYKKYSLFSQKEDILAGPPNLRVKTWF